MKLPTGEVPDSYQIYFEQFESDPQGTIKKLENHVTRRNSGAVGYYLLAILSRKAGNLPDAVKYALSAKILAPGSKFFNRLPYYIQHPELFEAWAPEKNLASTLASEHNTHSHPIGDLDQLISKLSEIEARRIKISEGETNDKDLSESSANVDDIVTETLALIHEKQGNYQSAINVYKQLRLANSSQRERYDGEIRRLQELSKAAE